MPDNFDIEKLTQEQDGNFGTKPLSREDLHTKAGAALSRLHNRDLKVLLENPASFSQSGIFLAEQRTPTGVGTRRSELSVLILLTTDRVSQSHSEIRGAGDVLKKVTSVLEGSSSLSGASRADQIITELQRILKTDPFLSKDEQFARTQDMEAAFDIAVITAISYGNEAASVELMTRVGEVLPNLQDGKDASQRDIFARFVPIIRKAMPLLQPIIQKQLAASLSMLGEANTSFAGAVEAIDVSQYPDAIGLKSEGENTLRNIAEQEYAEWADRQKVSDVKLRKKSLSDQALDEAVEDAIQAGQSWSKIDQMITNKVYQISSGKIANQLAAIIAAKMNPQLTVKERIAREKARVLGNHPGNLPDGNYFRDFSDLVYPAAREKDTKEREKLIGHPKDFSAERVGKFLVDHLGVDLTDASLVATFPHFIQEYLRSQHGSNPIALESATRVVTGKLIPVIDYLQICVQDPYVGKIMTDEFGLEGFGEANVALSGLPLPERLQAVRKNLLSQLNKIRPDAGEPVTESDRLTRDTADRERLAEISGQASTENTEITSKAREKTRRIIYDKSDAVTAQVKLIEEQRKATKESGQRQADHAGQIASIEQQFQALEGSPTSDGLFGGLGRNKNIPTKAGKAARLQALRDQLNTLKSQKSQSQEAQLQPDNASDADFQEAKARLAAITSIQQEALAA